MLKKNEKMWKLYKINDENPYNIYTIIRMDWNQPKNLFIFISRI
jgi:hypothetical protein